MKGSSTLINERKMKRTSWRRRENISFSTQPTSTTILLHSLFPRSEVTSYSPSSPLLSSQRQPLKSNRTFHDLCASPSNICQGEVTGGEYRSPAGNPDPSTIPRCLPIGKVLRSVIIAQINQSTGKFCIDARRSLSFGASISLSATIAGVCNPTCSSFVLRLVQTCSRRRRRCHFRRH